MSRYALVYDKCQSFQKRTGIKLFIFLYTLWTNVPHIRWYCRYFHYISCVWCMNHLTSTYINTYMPNSYTNISWLWITYFSQSNEITGAICMWISSCQTETYKSGTIERILAAAVASSVLVTPVFADPSVDDLKKSKESAQNEVSSLQTQLNTVVGKITELESQLSSKGEEIIQLLRSADPDQTPLPV